jgi:ferredoxin
MNWLSVAGKIADAVQAGISLDAGRCLHTIDRFSDCRACFQTCPVQAVQPGTPPVLDEEACQECLACLTVCPVDAFQGRDVFPALMRCASRLQGKAVEIICEHDPAPEEGSCSKRIGVQIKGCLAGLGVGGWAALALAGLESLHCRLNACADCRWSELRDSVSWKIHAANQLLESWGCQERVEADGRDPGDCVRELWQAEAPPLTRRDMFKMVTNQSQLSIAYALADSEQKAGKKPGRDQRRLAFLTRHLPDRTVDDRPLPPDIRLGTLEIGEQCAACCACARICPTGALELETSLEEETFQVRFNPAACVGCEACVHSCPEEAVRVNRAPSAADVYGTDQTVILLSGRLQRCEKCRTRFAGSEADSLCPICAARRKNPFGSHIKVSRT